VHTETAGGGSRRERLVYTLTGDGRAEFERLLRQVVVSFDTVHTGIDVAVVLMDSLPMAEAAKLLSERRTVVAARREGIVAELGDLARAGLLAQIAAGHLVALIDAEPAWIDRSLPLLSEEIDGAGLHRPAPGESAGS